MIQECVEEALPYILAEDPLEACLAHFGFEDYDIDLSMEEVNSLLDSAPPTWQPRFEPLPTLADSPVPPIESPPQLELKLLPANLKYIFLGPDDSSGHNCFGPFR